MIQLLQKLGNFAKYSQWVKFFCGLILLQLLTYLVLSYFKCDWRTSLHWLHYTIIIEFTRQTWMGIIPPMELCDVKMTSTTKSRIYLNMCAIISLTFSKLSVVLFKSLVLILDIYSYASFYVCFQGMQLIACQHR